MVSDPSKSQTQFQDSLRLSLLLDLFWGSHLLLDGPREVVYLSKYYVPELLDFSLL